MEPNLSKQLKALNEMIEDVKRWIFVLNNKEYPSPKYPDLRYYEIECENVQVRARVELWGIGRIYKRIIITGKGELLENMGEGPLTKVFERLLGPSDREDANLPSEPVFGDNQIMYIARYWPPGDYVKQLMEHRNFVTMPEFAAISDVLDKAYKAVGAGDKVPNYINPKPFMQVLRNPKVH